MSGLTQRSRIARPLDRGVPTNLAIVVVALLSAVGFAVWALLASRPGIDAVILGGRGLFLTFLAWAYTRELAPDDNPAAFMAVALALVAAPTWPDFPLIEVGALLVLTRVVNRSVGPEPFPHEVILLGALVLGVAVSRSSWPLALAGAFAFVAETQLHRPRPHTRMFAVGFLLACAHALWRLPPVWPNFDESGTALIVGIVVAFWGVIAAQGHPTSKGDRDGLPLRRARVRAGMAVAGIYGAGTLATSGAVDTGLAVWACLAGVVLGRVSGIAR